MLTKLRISWRSKLCVIVSAIFASFFLLSSFSVAGAEETGTSMYCESMAGEEGTANAMVLSVKYAFSGGVHPGRCSSANQFIVGSPQETFTIETEAGQTINLDANEWHYGGINGKLAVLDGTLYRSQPASTPQYTQYLAQKAGFAPETLAQSQEAITGYKMFLPLVKLWGLFRNVAYVVLIVFMMYTGFMIMISKTGGQGKENVSMFMGIVNTGVALVLITFSYGIAALMVDLCTNLGNAAVASLFSKYMSSELLLEQLSTPGTGTNIITLLQDLQVYGVGHAAKNLVAQLLWGIGAPLGYVTEFMSSFGEGANAGPGIIGDVLGFLAGLYQHVILWGLGSIGFGNSPLLQAIISFIMFVVQFRITFALLGAYFSLAMKIVLSPLILLPSALPGNLKVVGDWAKSLAADALVFPLIFAMFLMSALFFNMSYENPQDYAACKVQVKDLYGRTSSQPIIGTEEKSYKLGVTRFGSCPKDDPSKCEPISQIEECYPILLPPRFNYFPAPIGYLPGVDPDDLVRVVLGFGMILACPGAGTILKQLFGVQDLPLAQVIQKSVSAGLGAFGSYIGGIPSLGLGKAIGQLTKSVGGAV